MPIASPAMTPIQVLVAFSAVRQRADSQTPRAAANRAIPPAVTASRAADNSEMPNPTTAQHQNNAERDGRPEAAGQGPDRLGPQQVAPRAGEHEQINERLPLPLPRDAGRGRQADRADEPAEDEAARSSGRPSGRG